MGRSRTTPAPEAPEPTTLETPADAPAISDDGGTPAPVAAPPSGTDSGVAAATPSSALSDAGDSTPATPSTPTQQQQSVIDHLRQLGVQVPQGEDAEVARYIADYFGQAQQLQQLAPYAQAYLQNAAEFEKWRQSQRQQQPEAPQADKPWWGDFWNPPEYQQSWESLLDRDPNGNIVLRPGTPPDILPKYLAYRQYRQEMADKFLSNPYQFLEKPIQTLAEKIAKEQIQSHMGQFREQQYASSFARDNSAWLYQHGPDNHVLLDPITRQPVLSPWGSRFRDYVVQAERMGLRDVASQESFAQTAVQRDYYLAMAQAAQQPGGAPPPAPANPRVAANQDFLSRQGVKPRTPAANLGPSAATPEQRGRSLGDMLRAEFKANGITDNSIKEN